MATWPIDDKYIAISEQTIKPANRQTSSAGYTMSTAKGTVAKKLFDLKLSYLSKDDKDTLITFFDDNQGGSFTLNDPDPNSNDTYTVMFDQDEIIFEYIRTFPGEYSLNIRLREV